MSSAKAPRWFMHGSFIFFMCVSLVDARRVHRPIKLQMVNLCSLPTAYALPLKKDFGTSGVAVLLSDYLNLAAMRRGKWSLMAPLRHADGH